MSKKKGTAVATQPPPRDTPWHIAFDLEGDVQAISDYGEILLLISGTFENTCEQDSISRVGWDLIERSKKIEEKRLLICNGVRATK